jgi:uncharacterized protein
MIMQDILIPNFKQGNYSAGILQAVQALDTMARGRTVRKPVPAWYPWAFWGGLLLLVGVGISLIRSGRKGWGWALLGIVGAILVALLFTSSSGRARSSPGGRSFGGGFGGGGGAIGSW